MKDTRGFLQTQQSGQGAPDLPARAERLLRYEADIAFRRRGRTLVEYLDPQPGDRILDAGCGMGFQLTLLSRISDATFIGVELSEERLREAQRQVGPRASFVVGDVTRLPFEEGSVDKMILSEVLEHLPDDASALEEALRVLRPGGVLAITVPNKHYPFLWDPPNYVRERLGLGHFTREPLSGIWTDHRRLYTQEALTCLLRESGFEVADVRLETRHSLPFAHHVVYGLGKFVVERNLVSRSNGERAHRASFWSENARPTLVQRLISVFTAVDRYNRPRYQSGPAVSLCVKAVKPI